LAFSTPPWHAIFIFCIEETAFIAAVLESFKQLTRGHPPAFGVMGT